MEVEFTRSLFNKIFYSTVVTAFAAFMFILYFNDHSKVGPYFILVPIWLTIFAVIVVVKQFRARTIISADSIKVYTTFGSKEISTTNIKGIRMEDKYILIEAVSGAHDGFKIYNSEDYGDCVDLVKWLQENFTDLNAEDLKESTTNVLNNAVFGTSPEERKRNLDNIKIATRIYNIAGVVLGFVAIVNKSFAITALLLLYPLIGIVMMALSRGLIKFASNRNTNITPSVMLGFYLPALMMFINSLLEFNILSYHRVLPFAVSLSTLIFFLIYTTGRNNATRALKGQIIYMVALACLYGYGATININCLFDRSMPVQYQVTIIDRHIAKGKTTAYYLTLSPWGTRKNVEEVTIPWRLYSEVTVGNIVKVNYRQGLINIPWFTVTK
jgi:hypothetical protein